MAKAKKKGTSKNVPSSLSKTQQKQIEKEFLLELKRLEQEEIEREFEESFKQEIKKRITVRKVDTELRAAAKKQAKKRERKPIVKKGPKTNEQKRKDLANSISITKDKNNNLQVRNKLTGKSISENEFKKKFKISDTELKHLKSKEVFKIVDGKLESYFKFFDNQRHFTEAIDTDRIEDLRKYNKDVVFNKKKISFDTYVEKIVKFKNTLSDIREVYKLFINTHIDTEYITVRLTNELLDAMEEMGEDMYVYTDKNKNYVLIKSK